MIRETKKDLVAKKGILAILRNGGYNKEAEILETTLKFKLLPTDRMQGEIAFIIPDMGVICINEFADAIAAETLIFHEMSHKTLDHMARTRKIIRAENKHELTGISEDDPLFKYVLNLDRGER